MHDEPLLEWLDRKTTAVATFLNIRVDICVLDQDLEHAKPRDDSSDDGEGGVAMHVRGVVLWEPEEVSPIRLEHAIARADASFLQMIELGMSCHVL